MVKTTWSILIALLRFILVTFIFIIQGVIIILFRGYEIVDFKVITLPLRCDLDKMSYVDKLNMKNIDLYNVVNNEETPKDEEE